MLIDGKISCLKYGTIMEVKVIIADECALDVWRLLGRISKFNFWIGHNKHVKDHKTRF